MCASVLEESVEALSSGQTMDRPQPQLTILQDYEQILERYDDFEDDTGELRAESTLMEKFSKKHVKTVILYIGGYYSICIIMHKAWCKAVVFWFKLTVITLMQSHVVRAVCLNESFGFDCSLSCEDCANGGVCNKHRNGCDCPDGWTGIVCNESEFLWKSRNNNYYLKMCISEHSGWS